MMNFENWVNDTFASTSLTEAVSRHSSHQGLRKMRKALHMADSMLRNETVLEVAAGKFAGFGDSLLVVTSERLLVVKNSFQTGNALSLAADELADARFSHVPLMGHTLVLQGGIYRFSRISGDFIEGLRESLSAELHVPPFRSGCIEHIG